MLDLRQVALVHHRGRPNQVVALRDVTLTVPKGQFVTIVGSNGAGKSSLVKVVSGAAAPTHGTVWIGGREVTRQPDYRRARYVARVFDNPEAGTVADLSIEESIALAMRRGQRRLLRKAVTAKRRATMREALAVLGLGLENRLGDRVGLLSAGQRQSLTMVMATLSDPEVLLLDEHVAALDPATQQRVVELTVDIVGRTGCTALMVTHNMKHALDLGDRLLVLSRGRILADFSAADKARMSVDDLVHSISGAGDLVADRSLLAER